MQDSVAAEEVPTVEKATAAGRIRWIDALKGTLIILVAIGHLIIPVCDNFSLMSRVFNLIYLFHMPLFVFVSGFLAKHTVDAHGRLRVEKILTFLFLGFVYNVTLRLFEGASVVPLRLLMFPSAPWYLIAMGWWMLLVPFFDRFRPGWGVAISAVVSLCSALMSDQTDFLALSRTAHFLPYFVVGYYLDLGALERLRRPRVRVACTAAGIVAVGLFLRLEEFFLPIIGYVFGNTDCGLPLARAVPSYLVVSVFGLVLALGCLTAVPSRCRPLEFLGRRTFQIYVLHRFAKGALVMAGVYAAMLPLGPQGVCVWLVVVSILVCFASSWTGFTRVADRLLAMRWCFLLRDAR